MRCWAFRLRNAFHRGTLSRMTPTDLSGLLSRHRVSMRLLAEWLEVSHMWVVRRVGGSVEITDEDASRITTAFEQHA